MLSMDQEVRITTQANVVQNGRSDLQLVPTQYANAQSCLSRNTRPPIAYKSKP